MRILLVATVMVPLVAFSACGGSSNGTESRTQQRAENADHRAGECKPTFIAAGFEKFLREVSLRQRRLALAGIASPRSLLRVTIFHGIGAGEGRVDAETPAAVFESFARTIPQGATTTLLGAAVGNHAPFARYYERSSGLGEAAGMEFIARIGSQVLAGKIGVDCESRKLYVGAMNATASIGRRQLCGRYIQADAKTQVICRI